MWTNPLFPVDLIPFTEKILDGKLHFLCSKVLLPACLLQTYKRNFERLSQSLQSDVFLFNVNIHSFLFNVNMQFMIS